MKRIIAYLRSLGQKKVETNPSTITDPSTIRRMPITDNQVHVLIAGVINAYDRLRALNENVNAKVVGGGLFKGTSNVELKNTLSLGEFILNIFSLRFSTTFDIPNQINVGRSFEGTIPSNKELINMKRTHHRRIDSYVNKTQKFAKEEKAAVSNRTAEIRKQLRKLEQLVAAKEYTNLVSFLENLDKIAQWSTQIDLQQVYQAGKEMLELAKFDAQFVEEANHIAHYLEEALEESLVHPILRYDSENGRPIPNRKEKIMFAEKLYNKQLEHRAIASELIRLNNISFEK